MAGSNEAELEEVIASFRRVWRSGGRASLSLHANQGELEVRFGRKSKKKTFAWHAHPLLSIICSIGIGEK